METIFFSGQYYRTTNSFPFPGKRFSFQDQWISDDHAEENNTNGYTFRLADYTQVSEKLALVAGKNTEVFRLRPTIFPWELDLDMFNSRKRSSVGVRSAFYSAAFLLQRTLADELDVDPSEIEIADIRSVELSSGQKTAEIVITDELPNGSGFARKLFEDLSRFLTMIVDQKNASDFVKNIHSNWHQEKCQTSCYDCLSVFKNMNYHSLLDWRLGIALLRIMKDSTYKVGADGCFDKFIEIANWQRDAYKLMNEFMSSFGKRGSEQVFTPLDKKDFPIPAFTNVRQNKIYLIVHPLWQVNPAKLEEDTWLTEVIFKALDYINFEERNLYFLDTFNLNRRLGWCYEQLG